MKLCPRIVNISLRSKCRGPRITIEDRQTIKVSSLICGLGPTERVDSRVIEDHCQGDEMPAPPVNSDLYEVEFRIVESPVQWRIVGPVPGHHRNRNIGSKLSLYRQNGRNDTSIFQPHHLSSAWI